MPTKKKSYYCKLHQDFIKLVMNNFFSSESKTYSFLHHTLGTLSTKPAQTNCNKMCINSLLRITIMIAKSPFYCNMQAVGCAIIINDCILSGFRDSNGFPDLLHLLLQMSSTPKNVNAVKKRKNDAKKFSRTEISS